MDTITVGPEQVRSLVPMAEAIAAIRDGFIALARGEFEMPTRTVLRDGGFLVMSAHHRPTASAMVKTLSLNFDGRSPAITGTVTYGALAHTRHLVADANEVTRLRTGAATGVATDLLAPADASTCTVIGAGGQAADQVRAVHAVRPLQDLCVVARRAEAAAALARQLRDELGLASVRTESDADRGVRDAGIVCCATTSTTPLFAAESLRDDVHVNAIGAYRPTMREIPDELLATATVVIDHKESILAEAGDILHALDAGALTADSLTELGAALRDPVTRTGRTVFKSVGVAIQDWVIAERLARHVELGS